MAETLLAELKARCRDPDGGRRRLAAEAVAERTVRQVDTYFAVARGRLKLREVEGAAAELIHYERPDVAGVKSSRVRLLPVADGAATRVFLEAALGVRARVTKVREIWRWESVQVHVDEVEGLGTFVEFEEMVAAERDLAAALGHLGDLLARLGVPAADLCATSYADMVRR
ncbi:MAG TPA: class IV adenylate cyclase [Methylomirabilota bacterium]|nr:class IV adenylate cyclase [Methylomirabilota bacterium]